MLIDTALPIYDVATRHHLMVHAPRERVWRAVRELDLGPSRIVRSLFQLRGLGRRCDYGSEARAGFRLLDLVVRGFSLLGERPEEEIVLGVVGKFWRPAGPVLPLAAEEFSGFREPGWAKAVWGFSLAELRPGELLVTTETRVHCTDPRSRRAFLRYWRLIGPFSGLVRREALRIVRRTAESTNELA